MDVLRASDPCIHLPFWHRPHSYLRCPATHLCTWSILCFSTHYPIDGRGIGGSSASRRRLRCLLWTIVHFSCGLVPSWLFPGQWPCGTGVRVRGVCCKIRSISQNAVHTIYVALKIVRCCCASVTTAGTPEQVSAELTAKPVTNPAGLDFTNPQGFILAGVGFKTGGTDQGLRKNSGSNPENSYSPPPDRRPNALPVLRVTMALGGTRIRKGDLT